MKLRRVVVSGIGMVTPLGNTVTDTIRALSEPVAFGPATLFDARGFAEARAAEVRDLDLRAHFRMPKAIKLTDRATRFAVAAADMALRDAGWDSMIESREAIGVILGSSGSDLQAADLAGALAPDPELRSVADIAFFAERVLSGLNPLWLLVNLPNMPSAHVAIQSGARGPNSTVMTDWAAGSQAIGEAFELVRHGEADVMLAGGTDTAIQPFAYGGFEQSGLFRRAHDDGFRFVPAEGAAVLVLEALDHLRARGGTPRAELVGYTSGSSDPCSTSPAGSALARTIAMALDDAQLEIGEVAGIGLAGIPASPYCELERAVLDAVFADAAAILPRYQFKSMIGHALAAAGPIDLGLLTATGRVQAGPLLCNTLGLSGQAVTLAVSPMDGT